MQLLHPGSDTTARTFTLPSNAAVPLSIGSTITFVNAAGAGDLTIAINSDTLRSAVTGTTGPVVLVGFNVATALKIASTEWLITQPAPGISGYSGYSGASVVSPLAAKGDLFVYSSGDDRLPVGADWGSLTPVAADATGLRWYPGVGAITNQSVAVQSGFASDTYLVGSRIVFPVGLPIIGTKYRCIFDASKGLAGTGAPTLIIRLGTTGTTASDTARCTFTFTAGTALADTGTFEVVAIFRVVGASAVLQGRAQVNHNLSIGGFVASGSNCSTLQVTSGVFTSLTAGLGIGLSVSGSTSASWTVQLVEAELLP
jgi:hypothetical protein